MELDYGPSDDITSSGAADLNPRLAPHEVFYGKEDADGMSGEEDEEEHIMPGAPDEESLVMALEKLDSEQAAEPAPTVPGPIGGGLDVRLVALHLSGSPITQLSTSRLFALITHFGAAPLGLEWIDDQSAVVVFSDANSALAALQLTTSESGSDSSYPSLDHVEAAAQIQLLHERGETPAEEIPQELVDSLLLPRRVRNLPFKLYSSNEKETLLTVLRSHKEAEKRRAELPADAPAIYAEMAAEEESALENDPTRQALRKLRGPLWVRYALESSDTKAGRRRGEPRSPTDGPRPAGGSTSEWYRQHGRDAGREVVPRLLDIAPKRSRGRGNEGQSMIDAMDAELDDLRKREGDDDADQYPLMRLGSRIDETWQHDRFDRNDRGQRYEEGTGERRRGRGGSNRAAMDALDEELETLHDRNRDRSASPVRRAERASDSPASHVRIKGRGAMRAPGAGSRGWDDLDGVGRTDIGGDSRRRGGGGMHADEWADRRRGRGRRSGGLDADAGADAERWSHNKDRRGGGMSNASSLAERFGDGSGRRSNGTIQSEAGLDRRLAGGRLSDRLQESLESRFN
ncbi:Nucleotide-binding, alpha-beta plait [Ceraceosorus bombacis]|uniref:Nucleotide-binding, alpha-beta plait n=1 Tax=Ceraceosorus bombacis TaxID=401625 RepID=A0A0N7L9N3_9BASI|nr:Nucleotide-binding, alpha-beta plait [Ceraceosorus bombacis]